MSVSYPKEAFKYTKDQVDNAFYQGEWRGETAGEKKGLIKGVFYGFLIGLFLTNILWII